MDRDLIGDIADRLEDGAYLDEDEAAAAAKLLRLFAHEPPPAADDWQPISSEARAAGKVLVYRPAAPPSERFGVDWWRDGAWYRSRPHEQPTQWRTLESATPKS